MKNRNQSPVSRLTGHLLAAFAAFAWGTTYVFGKQLLEVWTSAELSCMRFFVAYVSLWLLCPRWEKTTPGEELRYALMGVTGCSLYYGMEHLALENTAAANVSIIICAAPVFTAFIASVLLRRTRLRIRGWLGLAVSMTGVVLVVLSGGDSVNFSPRGDLIAVAGALSWSVYSILQDTAMKTRKAGIVSRKVAFYGLLTSLPVLLFPGARSGAGLAPLARWDLLGGLLVLGAVGGGLCFFAWNFAQPSLGVVSTNCYLFASPFVTMLLSSVMLEEPVTLRGLLGTVLIIAGVVAVNGGVTERNGGFSPPEGV